MIRLSECCDFGRSPACLGITSVGKPKFNFRIFEKKKKISFLNNYPLLLTPPHSYPSHMCGFPICSVPWLMRESNPGLLAGMPVLYQWAISRCWLIRFFGYIFRKQQTRWQPQLFQFSVSSLINSFQMSNTSWFTNAKIRKKVSGS